MDNTWFQTYRWNTTSQHGEDGVLDAIFREIGAMNTWVIECGACDGKRYSNTWRLLNELDWNAVLIEGDRAFYRLLRRLYSENPKVTYIHSMVGIHKVDGLDSLLSKTKCPLEPDLCIIDVDGCDYWLWTHMTEYRPRVLMIEFNPTMPFWESIIQPQDPKIALGSSLTALVDLGKSKGYELVAVTIHNAIFVTKEIFPMLDIDDNSVWTIARHAVETITYVYQSYQNKIGFGGFDVRIWGQRHRLIRDLRKSPKITLL